jgi:molybdopterin-guanine dinucleotide biosynthesis protein A
MGTNKLYLESAGQTLLGRAVHLLQSVDCESVLVSGQVELPADHGVRQIPDLDFPHAGGPPRGLFSTLEWTRQELGLKGQMLLVIPADMPGLYAEILKNMIASAEYRDTETVDTAIFESPNHDAVIYRGEVFPLLVRATDKVHNFIRTGLENETQERTAPRFSMKTILAGLNTLRIDYKNTDDTVFSNLNTPEDWLRYTKQNN